MMKQDQYLHILSYLHFTDNMNEPDMADENFERPWKIRDLYNPSKNLAVDKLLFPSKGGWFLNIQKECKRFDNNIFKLCFLTGYS